MSRSRFVLARPWDTYETLCEKRRFSRCNRVYAPNCDFRDTNGRETKWVGKTKAILFDCAGDDAHPPGTDRLRKPDGTIARERFQKDTTRFRTTNRENLESVISKEKSLRLPRLRRSQQQYPVARHGLLSVPGAMPGRVFLLGNHRFLASNSVKRLP